MPFNIFTGKRLASPSQSCSDLFRIVPRFMPTPASGSRILETIRKIKIHPMEIHPSTLSQVKNAIIIRPTHNGA
jgi:hypothetical protein